MTLGARRAGGQSVGQPRRDELAGAFAKCTGPATAVAMISGAINILALTGSIYMLQVYDRVLTSRSVPTLVALTVLMVGLYAVYTALDVIRTRIIGRLAVRIDRQLRGRVFEAVLALPLRTRVDGDGMQPLRDLEQIRSTVAGPGPVALFDLPWMPFYLLMVYLLHPWLGLLATAGMLVLMGLTILTEVRSRVPSQAIAASLAQRNAVSESGRANAETIRAMGLGPRMMERWHA